LDVFRLLGRGIETIPALVLATYRDDQLDQVHPLRVVLGELPRAGVRRPSFAPLSVGAGKPRVSIRHRSGPQRVVSAGAEYRAGVEAGVTVGAPRALLIATSETSGVFGSAGVETVDQE
jgi:hypothetical protein